MPGTCRSSLRACARWRPAGRSILRCCFRLGCHGRRNARGAVTAEFAVALPAVLLLLALLLAGAAAGVTQLRLEEAARAGARALARGESVAAVEGIVRTLAGATATAAVAADGEWVSITVADRVGGPLGTTVPWTLTAVASTRSETHAARQMPGQELAKHLGPVALGELLITHQSRGRAAA
ncbi:hypothetical protein F8G81_19150 [Arthrobacter sp. CDRTa11]|nr:hypothetical protein F8G81_19150 [Arthrobacter sp. CDRTa11]